jgi:uncharacterized phage protein gp47/JayE
MPFGLDASGFTLKRLADIKTEIEDDLRSVFGKQLNLLPEDTLGQIVGIFAERESLIWELCLDVYNSQYPDSAEGVQLDNVVALTGLTRLQESASRVDVILFGTIGAVVPVGTIFSVDGNPDATFETIEPATLIAGTDETQDIDFDTVPDSGDFKISFDGEETATILFSASALDIENALNALPNIGSGGVSVSGNFTSGFTVLFDGATVNKRNVPALIVTENNLLTGAIAVETTVTETVPGVPQATVVAEAQEVGPIQAPKGSLTVIDTPVFGLDSIINQDDQDPIGRNTETDTELRSRREETIQLAGAGTVEAIRSRLLSNVPDVTAVTVFENNTQITDSDGRPPKTFEAIVQGGEDQDIWNEIWASKPAGIGPVGSVFGAVDNDSQGFNPVMRFNRPTELDIYLELDLSVDESFVNTVQEIKDAIVIFGNALGIGETVIVHPDLEAVLSQFEGITDVEIRIGTAPSPTVDDNVEVAANEISSWDDSRIDITVMA